MFKLNKEVKTITGEILKPFLVENKTVYCLNRSGKTIIKKLEDFNFDIEKITIKNSNGPSVITVTPKIFQEDQLFEPLKKEKSAISNTINRPTIEKSTSAPAIETNIETNKDILIDAIKLVPISIGTKDGEFQSGGVKIIKSEEPKIKDKSSEIKYIDNDDYI